MENVNQISQCQTLWARNKYLVLSHSSKIYLEIRQYLKSDSVEAAHVQDLIDQAVALPENRGQVSNVTLNSLKSPDKVQMPHRLGVFSICQDVNSLCLLLRNNLFDVSCLRLMVAWEAFVEGVLNIIAVLNFCLILAQIFWAQK